MRKLSALLVLSLLVTLGALPAHAASEQQSEPVYLNYTFTAAREVVSIDVLWESMDFVYNAGSAQGKWNTETHAYDTITPTWEKTDSKITVKNHSNKNITANFAFKQAENAPCTGTLSELSVALDSAVGKDLDETPSGSTVFTISGSIPSTQTEQVDLGTISVTVGG